MAARAQQPACQIAPMIWCSWALGFNTSPAFAGFLADADQEFRQLAGREGWIAGEPARKVRRIWDAIEMHHAAGSAGIVCTLENRPKSHLSTATPSDEQIGIGRHAGEPSSTEP